MRGMPLLNDRNMGNCFSFELKAARMARPTARTNRRDVSTNHRFPDGSGTVGSITGPIDLSLAY